MIPLVPAGAEVKPIVPMPGCRSKVAPAPRAPRSKNVSVSAPVPFVILMMP